MKTNNTIAWRIQSLEKKVDDLNTDVNNLLQNHIPHINEQMASLKTRISVLSAVNIGAIIVGILIAKYL